MQASHLGIIHVEAGEGKAFWVGTSLVTCKVGSEDTEGRYSLFESCDQPHSGPPMHVHHREDESYYILEGVYEFHTPGSPPLRASPGSFVYIPRDVIHTYKNGASTPGRMVVLAVPAGLEQFFAEIGQLVVDSSTLPSSLPDLAQMAAIARKHDLEVVGPPVQ